MAFTIDGTAGLTFNNGTTQNSGSKLLQVVNATYSVSTTNNTSTMASSGLTASITPLFNTSKILVIANVAGISKFTSNTAVTLQLYRNAGNVLQFAFTGGATNSTSQNGFAQTTSYLDSPATTSATSYTVYFASQQNTAGVTVQFNGDFSTITLMEIAV